VKSITLQLLQLTRNSSGDEIENVNFFYDDIVHVLQNTIDSFINSTTDRRGGCGGTYVYPIQWNNAITPFKVIQGHRFWYQSKSQYTTSY